MVQEREYQPISGWVGLVVGLGLLVGGGWCFYTAMPSNDGPPDVWWLVGAGVCLMLGILTLCGLQASSERVAGVLAVRPLHRVDAGDGLLLGEPVFHQNEDLASGAQLRDRRDDDPGNQRRDRESVDAQVTIVGATFESQ